MCKLMQIEVKSFNSGSHPTSELDKKHLCDVDCGAGVGGMSVSETADVLGCSVGRNAFLMRE